MNLEVSVIISKEIHVTIFTEKIRDIYRKEYW